MDWTGGYVYPINSSMITIDKEGLGINDLENRIEKLEEGFRKIELKNEREKRRRVYDLMGRVGELNKDTIWIVVDDPSKIVRLEDY